MSDEIVARLRQKYQGHLPICAEAADEIERLRNELKAFEKGYLVIQEDRQHLRKQVVLWQDIAINLAHHSEGWIDGGKAFEDYLDNLEGKAVRGER